MPRWAKRAVLWAIDLCALPLIFLMSHTLRLSIYPAVPTDWQFVFIAPLITVAFLQMAGYYRVVIRFIDFNAIKAIATGLALSLMFLYVIAYLGHWIHTPRSIFVIYCTLASVWLLASRLLARELLRWSGSDGQIRVPVAIFGAGSAGMQTATSLKHDTVYQSVAFIDDNPSLRGQLVSGLPVFSRNGFRQWIVKNNAVKTVLLAIPSSDDEQRRLALQYLTSLGMMVKTLPGLADLVSGRANINEIQDVNVADLLSRRAVDASSELMASVITGSRVMITGAGGSIGSELCRQIISLKPQTLLLFEVSEFALYQIEQDLLKYPEASEVNLVPVLGSVLDRKALAKVFQQHQIQTVFHAAAYKHVPLVESNICAGVKNNTLGTRITAETALANGVSRFILVSTDKAVRPTNVMGASKRMAEMTLQALAAENPQTIFAMVRFGNVLDSSGSVVPLFRTQINAGGPVTVTHPDITRFFMTIPEAASLVVQAGAMAKGGEVYLLDMGEPVKIDQLARTMIQLMGRTIRDESGEGDIAIEYSGLRPGEKLYEELLIDAQADATEHAKIFKAREAFVPMAEFQIELDGLMKACEIADLQFISQCLQRCVAGYVPDVRVVDPFWSYAKPMV